MNLNIFVDMVTMVVDYRFALTGIVRAFSGRREKLFLFSYTPHPQKAFHINFTEEVGGLHNNKKKIQSRKGMQ